MLELVEKYLEGYRNQRVLFLSSQGAVPIGVYILSRPSRQDELGTDGESGSCLHAASPVSPDSQVAFASLSRVCEKFVYNPKSYGLAYE